MRCIFPSIEISIVRHWQMKKLFYNTKSGLRVFGFCPVGSTCKVDLTLPWIHDCLVEFIENL